MSPATSPPPPRLRSSLRAYAPVLIFAAAVTLARLAYLAWFSPYQLSEDEAFYWEWSLRPDWSYATKGPGIAWAIWLATHTLGTTELAIRAVPVPTYTTYTLSVQRTPRDSVQRTLSRGAPDSPIM